MTANMQPNTKKQYDLRFKDFLKQIVNIGRMKPREKYLYPLMNGVPFRDLEVAIAMCSMAFEQAVNDNTDKENN